MCVAWPRSFPHAVLGQRAVRNGCAVSERGRWAAGSCQPGSALPHSSSRSSSLQMQALLWLFMKGRQPRVQTALNTVSATDSQAGENVDSRHVSDRHLGWLSAGGKPPQIELWAELCGAWSWKRGLLASPWVSHVYKSRGARLGALFCPGWHQSGTNFSAP